LIADCTRDVQEQPPRLEELAPGRLRYTSEPSDVRDAFEFTLAPPALEREVHGDGRRITEWDWNAFRGDACVDGACAQALPSIDLPEQTFARGGWRSTSLGRCALRLEGSSGATVRLLLSGDVLYVEIRDPAFVTTGPVVDTLDIGWWFVESKPGATPRHARLRMDGQLVDASGHVSNVETAQSGDTRRFAIPGLRQWMTSPMLPWEITYEDTDDGRTVQRLSTGSHDLQPTVFRAQGRCTITEGSLEVVRVASPDVAKALAP
jgi:hypothetical protein